MRARVELIVFLVLLVTLGVLVGSLGARRNRVPSADPRRSTFLSNPAGAKAYADALGILHVRVDRFRRRTAELSALVTDTSATVLALLDPLNSLDGTQAEDLLNFLDTRGDLLLAGRGASAAMRCFGYHVDVRGPDSTAVFRVHDGRMDFSPVTWTMDQVLARSADSIVTDTSDMNAGAIAECVVRQPVSVDTILLTSGGRTSALRLHFGSGARVTLLADGVIFSTGRMKESDAGLVSLPLVVGTYHRAIFDEFEHGFGPEGSLLGAIMKWSTQSPWGWAIWQLAIVGVIALIASAIRFGAPRSVIDRRRRSPLEHVRALATALSAAGGSRVAVDLMVRGLRRRLSPGGHSARGDPQAWLESLAQNVRSTRSRQAVRTLLKFTRRAPGSDNVLRAAYAVEDVWQDLKPPSPTR
ncbi:MAG: DUF4350 domain-containing protein [Gemmatimonadota bacterium]